MLMCYECTEETRNAKIEHSKLASLLSTLSQTSKASAKCRNLACQSLGFVEFPIRSTNKEITHTPNPHDPRNQSP